MKIDCEKEILRIQSFLKETLKKTGKKKIIVAVSGGVDSSVSVSLCSKAIGVENMILVLLPYGNLNQKGLKNSMLLINHLNVPQKSIKTIDIRPAVDLVCKHLGISETEHTRKGNIMARIRMIMLFDIAKKSDALVLGTENRSEYYLGYFTRFGDEASDIEPIRHLFKTQVYELARILDIPPEIISSPPTAGLWEGQTDEDQFGFSYKEADKILELYFDQNVPFDKISLTDHPKRNEVRKIVLQNKFKHKTPYLPR